MNKETVKQFFKSIRTSISEHSPEILTGIGIAGMVTTTVLAVKATPKALYLLEDRKNELEVDKLSAGEVVKTTWKCYIPATLTGAFSTACIIGASSVNAKRNAALATAYKLAEESLSIYKEKVVETIGEKKEKAIREKVDKERIEKNPVGRNEVIITEKGNTLCYDVISGRYFKSDITTLKKVQNKLNEEMLNSDYVSLSEFYDEIGLSHTKNSDSLGWNVGRDGLIDMSFSTQLSEDDVPCIVVDYCVAPRYNYWKMD